MSVKLEKDFSSWMDAYLPQDVIRVGVGVSGGADSLCLVYLLKKYCETHQIELYAFTVDHGLRKESVHEAKSVHSMLTKWGVKHQTLRWVGQKPKTGIEEKARQACQETE
jgi:tRNA(Ile)-lysidine synthase